MMTEIESQAAWGDGPVQNTDRHLWPITSPADGSMPDTLHVTADGLGIGINCGGRVIVKTMREWHQAANAAEGLVRAMELLKRGDDIINDLMTERTTRETAGRALLAAIAMRFPGMGDQHLMAETDIGEELIKAFKEFRAALNGQ